MPVPATPQPPVPAPAPVVQPAPIVKAQAPTPVSAAPPAPTPAPAPVPEVKTAVKAPLLTKPRLIGAALAVGFIVMMLLLVSATHDRNKLKTQVSKLSGTPTANGAQQVSELTKQIGAVFQLPTGETPTLATVSDASKVRSQAFFKDTQNGDKVLLYSKAGEAILYRPSTKKIISVAPVNLNGDGSSAKSTTPTP